MIKKTDKKVETINDLALEMRAGFARVDQAIESLAIATAKSFESVDDRFESVEGRLDKVEKTLSFHTEILEEHTGILLRLDQERLFTVNHVNRLEKEIHRIKKHLKIA